MGLPSRELGNDEYALAALWEAEGILLQKEGTLRSPQSGHKIWSLEKGIVMRTQVYNCATEELKNEMVEFLTGPGQYRKIYAVERTPDGFQIVTHTL